MDGGLLHKAYTGQQSAVVNVSIKSSAIKCNESAIAHASSVAAPSYFAFPLTLDDFLRLRSLSAFFPRFLPFLPFLPFFFFFFP